MSPAINMTYPKGWSFDEFLGKATVKTDEGEKITGMVISLEADKFVFSNPRFFSAIYGTVNGIWDQLSVRENGGSMIVPFSVNPKGELFVAGGYEIRPLFHGGEKMFTSPGGWKKDTDEKSEETAIREANEESDLKVTDPIQAGVGINNRAINLKNIDDPWPTTYFGMKVDWNDLIPFEKNCFQLRGFEKKNADIDRLSTLSFIDVYEAMFSSPDSVSVTGFAKVLAAWKKGILQ